jgi:hypothetical protein
MQACTTGTRSSAGRVYIPLVEVRKQVCTAGTRPIAGTYHWYKIGCGHVPLVQELEYCSLPSSRTVTQLRDVIPHSHVMSTVPPLSGSMWGSEHPNSVITPSTQLPLLRVLSAPSLSASCHLSKSSLQVCRGDL